MYTRSKFLVAGAVIALLAQLTIGSAQLPDAHAATATTHGSIEVRVWHDANINGIQDDGELGITSVTVNVWPVDAQGNITGQPTGITTGLDGRVSFDVPAGIYRINVIVPTDGAGFTVRQEGDDNTVDSDVYPDSFLFAFSDPFTVVAGEVVDHIDAGVLFNSEVGGRVWSDDDLDGIQDPDEAGIGGFTVWFGNDGRSVVTDDDGNYFRGGLKPGTYQMIFINTTNGDFTAQNVGDDALDSDADANGIATVSLGSGESNLTVDAGLIPPVCQGQTITINMNRNGGNGIGTAGDDVILGTPGDDVIAAGGGDDLVCAGGGDDVVFGQAGDDTIYGHDGSDTIRGGADNDTLHGGDDADDVSGGSGDDFVYGDAGDDTKVRGGVGDDHVFGGDGDDLLVTGNGGEDTVEGGDGNDIVNGGPRPDTVRGGPGDDVLKGNNGADTLEGGDGDDELLGGPSPDTLDGGNDTDVCKGGTTGGGAPESDSATNCETAAQVP